MLFDPRSLVDPAFFSRLESIELRARSIVEGSMYGLHRSPYLGLSVEFASHREYTPGDDLRHLNWKLYARHDRLYIKEAIVGRAFALKRFHTRGRGRSARVEKHFAHLTVVVRERAEERE